MTNARKKRPKIAELEGLALPGGWRITDISKSGNYAIVEIPIDDLKEKKVRLVKLPSAVRAYFRERQREYRARLKKRSEG